MAVSTTTVHVSVETDGLQQFTSFFKAFCNGTRASIIEQLLGGERCVCEIVASVDGSQPLISHHLSVLHEAGFVRRRNQGARVYYSIDWDEFSERLDAFIELIDRRRTEGNLPAVCE